MPLPLLFIIPAVVGAKVESDKLEAKVTNEQANSILTDAKHNFDFRESACSEALSALGRKKVFVLGTSIANFITTVEKLKNVELQNTVDLNELGRFRINQNSIIELKEMKDKISTLIVGGSLSVMGGGLLTLGAFSGLGSIVAGGAAFGLGNIVMLAKAKSQKDKAYANLAEAKRAAEELNNAGLVCDGIRRRSNMFYNLLVRLDSLFTPLVIQTASAIQEHKGNYQCFSLSQKHTVAATFALAGTIKAVLDTPILSKNGELTEESERLIPQVKEQIKMNNRKILPSPHKYTTQNLQCSNCGKIFISEIKFCTQCGAKL